ncbi:MAG: DNA polymerase ligase N-terminal domain-containing protein [Candidatus Babeliales bacterium]
MPKVSKKTDKLKEYKEHRDLKYSTEPSGKSKSKKLKHPIYVVQEHHATHLHYDLRLEFGGVLKSWAIPKGIPIEHGEKRLAVPTDDHPLDYATFQGVIPEGHYGAGTVIIWDFGTYQNLKSKDMQECYDEGKIEIFIDGEKIQGNYALIRTKLIKGNKYNWIILKMKN